MSTKSKSRGRVVLVRLLLAVLGLVAGLVIAEGAFYLRDEGAFPHANFYLDDDALGVRLEPGAESRILFPGNPVSDIRVNAQGYRGADWGAPADDEILVVGDSQVFGLGVEEDETFTHHLSALTERPVLNGGVPTYGPLEYEAVVREVFEARHPKTVVYVVNFLNDLFENERPNRDRHVAWDGWAVRAETAPLDYYDFPGRRFLYQRSHLLYAVRRYIHSFGANSITDASFASEGNYGDLVALGQAALSAESAAIGDAEARERAQLERLARTSALVASEEEHIDRELFAHAYEESGVGDELFRPETELRVHAVRGNPGDIVETSGEESSRPLAITATLIRQGVAIRERLVARLAARRAALRTAIETRDAARAEQQALRATATPELAVVPSVLETRLRSLKSLCDARGAELVVVALPIDVQVSNEEWRKYGREPIDMSGTRVLLHDLVEDAHRLGLRALDATAPLAAAEPGAFLVGDIHMTPKGHEALARALAATLDAPLPIRAPSLALPTGRSRVPYPDEWLSTPEATVRGSSRAQCETTMTREWFRATCVAGPRHQPSGATLLEGGHGEAMIVATQNATTLVVPLLEGDTVRADFFWEDRTQTLVLRYPVGGARDMAFEDPRPGGRPFAASAHAAKLCQCYGEVVGERACRNGEYSVDFASCRPVCTQLYGGEDRDDCFRTYADDCVGLLECVRGNPFSIATCEEGSFHALATLECARGCSDAAPCREGTCTSYGGSAVCL